MRIVLVHGYLANAAVLWPLARRMRRLGHQVETYAYPSHRGTLGAHAEGLATQLRKGDDPVAVVAHSLGGLLAHHAMTIAPDANVSHRIFVATPHRGSKFARRGRKSPIARLLSPAVRMASHGYPMPASEALTGVVIGTKDRMIRPEEADLAAAHARLELPFGHNELLMRPNLAHALHRFLTDGHFEAPLPRFRP